MPQYLRAESLRLLESATEAFTLALTGLGTPPRREFRDPSSQFAPIIGLMGVAVEQSMAAILVQVHGHDVMFRGSKADKDAGAQSYKTFQQILHDLRDLLRNGVPRSNFLTAGLDDPEAHIRCLMEQTDGFLMLGSQRALGLHAGKGPSREVVYHIAQKVFEFMKSLSKSKKLRAYLEGIPVLPQPPEPASILIEDLARKLAKTDSRDTEGRASLISSIFLVLPSIPDQEPEWLEALERVAVAPSDSDLSLLVTTLHRAIPVQLQKLSANAKAALSMAVRPNDPDAIPVAPYRLKRQLTEICDQFDGDVVLANGRLQSGMLHLPPEEFTRELFCLTPAGVTQILKKAGPKPLTAHDVWPFIVTALKSKGTEPPFWFLVGMVEDLGQVRSQVGKAMALAGEAKTLKARHQDFLRGLESIMAKKPAANPTRFQQDAADTIRVATNLRMGLRAAAERHRGTPLGLTADGEEAIAAIVDGGGSLDEGLPLILAATVDPEKGKPYWARILCEAASTLMDVHACFDVLGEETLGSAHTAARKALHRLDLVFYGPGATQAASSKSA